MFLKRERTKKDHLKEEEKNSDTLAKTSQNIYAYSFVSEHSKHVF